MNLGQLHNNFKEQLTAYYPKEEVQSFFEMLAAHHLHLNRAQIVLDRDLILDKPIIEAFNQTINRLKSQEPIQHIIGETEFYGMTFKVTPDTLIPRPETEELVDWVLQDYKLFESPKVLDLCTGSGCIALALAHNMNRANVMAIDISDAALKVAQVNANRHELMVDFNKLDLLKGISIDQKFDVIVSNPPYVRDSEKEAMAANVLEFEPSEALFVLDEDPLRFYRIIGQYAVNHLSDTGALYLEINEYLSKEMHSLLKDIGFTTIEVRQDIFGKNRMIKCC